MRAQASIWRATIEAAFARGGSGRFHRLQNRLRDDDAGNFVVQAQRLLVTIQRPDADEHGDGWLAAEFFHEGVPVLGIEKRLGHGEVRAGFDFGVEALDFVVEIVGDGIQRDADGEICRAAQRFAGPVRALIETAQRL